MLNLKPAESLTRPGIPFLPLINQLAEKTRDANEAPMNNTKMGNDQYCLRWNSYETNILSTFEGLLDSEALSDVTLFCEGESFKAHRLVLAACSAHFSKLFANSTLNGQLIVILDGTRHQDLQILLQFMYRGVAYLHQDRIESVLRTAEVLQVKGLSDGGVDGVNPRNGGEGGGGGRPSPRAWSPPPAPDPLKKEVEPTGPLGPRPNSPTPSGRIRMPADSPLPPSQGMPPPIFGPAAYGRSPNTNLLYQSFGYNRPESSAMKPTSTSALSFPPVARKPTDLPSPGPRESASQYSKFSPVRGERERDEMYEVGSGSANRTKEFDQTKSPNQDIENRERSPPSGLRNPASTDQPFGLHSPQRPKQIATSDSTTDKGGVSPPHSSRRYDEDGERAGSRSLDQVKSETVSSPVGDSRQRTYSGDFSSRESLSRLSSQSTPSRTESLIGLAAQDLRTNDHDERIKRENNLERFEALRRMAAQGMANASSMATIQKLEMFQQSQREAFLPPGGFSVPLTAPLGIPASDLARIAQTVPDPSANGANGATSGTGTKLKCPFCERTYGYETNLRAHIRQRHQGIRVPCPFCHRSFTRNNTVRRHIAREHRHQVNPKTIPSKFGSTKVMPDQSFQDHLNAQP